MAIVNAGFDIHRGQIAFDALDAESGEVATGRIAATPDAVRRWVGRFPGREVHVALEPAPAGTSSPARSSARGPSPTWPRSP
jgi:hypothetical protein